MKTLFTVLTEQIDPNTKAQNSAPVLITADFNLALGTARSVWKKNDGATISRVYIFFSETEEERLPTEATTQDGKSSNLAYKASNVLSSGYHEWFNPIFGLPSWRHAA